MQVLLDGEKVPVEEMGKYLDLELEELKENEWGRSGWFEGEFKWHHVAILVKK
jgi:hypothetical protein